MHLKGRISHDDITPILMEMDQVLALTIVRGDGFSCEILDRIFDTLTKLRQDLMDELAAAPVDEIVKN